MSKDNRDRLEIEINRYLDGEISDEDFEKFLKEWPEDFDLESFRTLKTRVEKIEELYAQMEEPAVPDDYWETFADRVDERIGGTERPSAWEKLLNVILPTRWPKMAFGYAGAVVSVLLVFVIGKTIMESGADKYQPAAYRGRVAEDISHEQPTVGEVETGDVAEAERDVLPEHHAKIDVAETKLPDMDREKKADIDQLTDDEISLDAETPSVDQDAGSGGAADGAVTAVSPPEPSGKGPAASEIEAGDVASKIEIADEAASMPKPVADEFAPEIGIVEPSPIPPVEQEEPALQELGNLVPDIQKQSAAKSAMSKSLGFSDAADEEVISDVRVWRYDSWNIEDLRLRLKHYDETIADSAYSSEAFSDYAEIKTSLAVLTRDSTDIHDALSAVDTLLIYNQDIDIPSWIKRRQQIQSLRNPIIEP